MELGAFSISLAVKDIQASKAFYEKLGFRSFAGDASQNWLIMKNEQHAIGLFQGMFDRNILTFNPGWDQNAQKLQTFTDVRDVQRQLKAQGVQFATEADEGTNGPPVSLSWTLMGTRSSSISTSDDQTASRMGRVTLT